jgi:hypothetical protein
MPRSSSTITRMFGGEAAPPDAAGVAGDARTEAAVNAAETTTMPESRTMRMEFTE